MAFAKKILYRETDPRDLPAYTALDAARYLSVQYHTLYSWIRPIKFPTEHGYSERPIIQRPEGSQHLSFLNLIEAHIVKALLKTHNVPLADLRSALEYCQREFAIDHLLVDKRLKVGNRGLFIKLYGKLIHLGKGGQLALDRVLDRYLERVSFDARLPTELAPFVLDRDTKVVSISPYIAFGKPVVSDKRITTHAIAERFELGETKQELAKDYGIGEEQVEEAILYESAA